MLLFLAIFLPFAVYDEFLFIDWVDWYALRLHKVRKTFNYISTRCIVTHFATLIAPLRRLNDFSVAITLCS
jgi:hypothetical protein